MTQGHPTTTHTPTRTVPGLVPSRLWRTRHGAEVPAVATQADAPSTTLQPYYVDPALAEFTPGGCRCQTCGKSGVPHPSGKCMVCGYRVNLNGAVA